MTRLSALARVWFGLTAVVVAVALWLQIPITASGIGVDANVFPTPADRVGNLFTFFTILTNLMVAVTGIWLVIAPASSSLLLRVLRVDALLGIVVTGIVYWTMLAYEYTPQGAEWWANQLFHTVTPIMVPLGWLLFGPRRLIDGRVVALAVIYPVAWLVFTLVRGEVIGWYPYPFLDVIEVGYRTALFNCVGITFIFAALALLFWGADLLLSRRVPVPAR